MSLPASHQGQRKRNSQGTQRHSQYATAPQHARNRNTVARHKRHPQQFAAPPNCAIIVDTRAQLQTVVQNQSHWLNQQASEAVVTSPTPSLDIRHQIYVATGLFDEPT